MLREDVFTSDRGIAINLPTEMQLNAENLCRFLACRGFQSDAFRFGNIAEPCCPAMAAPGKQRGQQYCKNVSHALSAFIGGWYYRRYSISVRLIPDCEKQPD